MIAVFVSTEVTVGAGLGPPVLACRVGAPGAVTVGMAGIRCGADRAAASGTVVLDLMLGVAVVGILLGGAVRTIVIGGSAAVITGGCPPMLGRGVIGPGAVGIGAMLHAGA